MHASSCCYNCLFFTQTFHVNQTSLLETAARVLRPELAWSILDRLSC